MANKQTPILKGYPIIVLQFNFLLPGIKNFDFSSRDSPIFPPFFIPLLLGVFTTNINGFASKDALSLENAIQAIN